MIDVITKTIAKFFGTKSDKDIKKIRPLVEQCNAYFEEYQSLRNDELRQKTLDFKGQIQDALSELHTEIQQQEDKLKDQSVSDKEKEAAYEEIAKLQEEKDEIIEDVLAEILPEAFATVKAASERFAQNEQIEVAATELDRHLATQGKDFLTIENDTCTYFNHWKAAGSDIQWNMVHYDVQLIGGVVLHEGKIAEMATGEGKTLVSTLPAYLNALAGEGVHIITVNDYLARRDCEWNAPLFNFLGISVDCIEYYKPHSDGRKKAYQADITYGTNNEFGFDYLRDNMAHRSEEMVQRKHHYAMIDEVDSVLVDDARTPLIISGPTGDSKDEQKQFYELKPRVERLMNAQKQLVNDLIKSCKKAHQNGELTQAKETSEMAMGLLRAYRGLPKNTALIKLLSESGVKSYLQKVENFYLQDQAKEMVKIDEALYFTIEEKNNQIELTDKGLDLMAGKDDRNLYILPDVGSEVAELEKADLPEEEKATKKEVLMRDFGEKTERIHALNQLLKAYTLFQKDIEYIVSDEKIKIVDEQTGRVMEGRRYSDGLHQAIEAKENVKVEKSTQTYASITLQNYFRMYHKLCGMTGTAETEAGEFWEIYKLDVVVIPTNKPIVRDDQQDLIYKTKREKYQGVIEHIKELTEAGRPVLVGTTSVEVSELMSKMMKMRKMKHNVLNAKQHQKEAEIVSDAGKPGMITIATNMAGRGTDIKINDEVKSSGGLAIIGTERHESRRIDRQLRGRAGRQGDPGSSVFFVSLEDNLMRLFGSERIATIMDRFGGGLAEGEHIQHSQLSKSIERAQRKVEENNFGIRKNLLEYDDVMNKQREVIYEKRKNALLGKKLRVDIVNMMEDLAKSLIPEFKEHKNYEGFRLELLRLLAVECPFTESEFLEKDENTLIDDLYEHFLKAYDQKNEYILSQVRPFIEKVYEERKESVERIVVPFTDGYKVLENVVDLSEAHESQGKAIIESFEKTTMMVTIDMLWKDHLREMDDLRTSVRNASFEQKDPLLIYKFESFNLFEQILDKMNREALSMLFRGRLYQQQRQQAQPKEAPKPKKAVSEQAGISVGRGSMNPNKPEVSTNKQENQSNTPIRKGKKVGRNEPCPCGSGKKYKNCHGKPA